MLLLLLLLLLLLSRFNVVWLCVTPWTTAHQAPPSLGFSRQEHWSGLPFPSPMHKSKKWKWNRSVMSNRWAQLSDSLSILWHCLSLRLEWKLTFSSDKSEKWKVKVKLLSRVRLLETPWTVALQAPLSMGFSRQEYWSVLSLPSPINVTTRK